MTKYIHYTEFDDDSYLKAVDNFYDLIWDMDIDVPEEILEIYRSLAEAYVEDIIGEGEDIPSRENAVNYEVAAIQVAMYFAAPYKTAGIFEGYTGITIFLESKPCKS